MGEEKKEDEKEEKGEKEEKEPEEKEEEKKDEKKENTETEEKKPGFLDNLKSIGSHVQLPSFLSKKDSKIKDVEAGGDKDEESKELLEKKEKADDAEKEAGGADTPKEKEGETED